MRFGRSAIQSNVIALFMLQQRRRLACFPTALRHARKGPNVGIPFDVPVDRVSLAARHMPFSGQLGGQYATLVGIVTAIAFDPLAHGRARRRHDRNRQNTTCRELQSFMRFWRVTEADNVWEDNRGDELNALLPGAQ
jgi:hypothetical protein